MDIANIPDLELTDTEWEAIAVVIRPEMSRAAAKSAGAIYICIGPDGAQDFKGLVDANDRRDWVERPATEDDVRQHVNVLRYLLACGIADNNQMIALASQRQHINKCLDQARRFFEKMSALTSLDVSTSGGFGHPVERVVAETQSFIRHCDERLAVASHAQKRRGRGRPAHDDRIMEYWLYLMVLWHRVLRPNAAAARLATSPKGPLPRFLVAASASIPQREKISSGGMHEFVRAHRDVMVKIPHNDYIDYDLIRDLVKKKK